MPVDMTSSSSQIFLTTQEGRNHVLFHFSIKVRSYAKSLICFFEHLQSSCYIPQWFLQIMRSNVSEVFKICIGSFQIGQCPVESVFRLLAFGDVYPHLQNEQRAIRICKGKVEYIVIAAIRAGPLPMMGGDCFQNPIRFANLAWFGSVKEE